MNEIEPALRRAYALGQKYWQQADSDFARYNRKADETQAKFNQLVESMQGWLSPAEADNLRTQLAEAQKDAARGKFWGIGEVPIAGLTFRAAIDAAKG